MLMAYSPTGMPVHAMPPQCAACSVYKLAQTCPTCTIAGALVNVVRDGWLVAGAVRNRRCPTAHGHAAGYSLGSLL